ncbi:P-loop containing nucleoside triphosphate hydrolases superfamily protein [Perilla frutescens var. frutescens]|nr:P-loop containing nucleoside triphosphate hydrolases superfamily protein [Perilla frutescens var. frutescens]
MIPYRDFSSGSRVVTGGIRAEPLVVRCGSGTNQAEASGLAAVINSEDLPALAPQSCLRGQSFPNTSLMLDDPLMDRIRSSGVAGFSIFWRGLVRIDIMKALPQTHLTFYGPKALQLHIVPTEEADEFY